MAAHVSVLLNEALAYLDLKKGQRIVDGTLGRGGHALKILEKILPGGTLIGIDRDPEAVRDVAKRLEAYKADLRLLQRDFRDIAQVLSELGIEAVDGMFLDLGVSSPQLEDASRGFSFQNDGPLDMRMDPSSSLTTEMVVNEYSPEKLRQVLWDLGEERLARRIVDRIVEARETKRIRTTKELENIIFHAAPKAYRYGRTHPATRSFQAFRIAVNGELEALGQFLKDSITLLREGGRLVVISFHSLEDRIVKNAFRDLEKSRMGMVLTKKPVVSTESEIQANPRSRSAKLRAFLRGLGSRS